MGKQNQEPEHPLENLMRLGLVVLGLTIVIAVAVACLPAHSSMGRGWRAAFASLTRGMNTAHQTSAQLQTASSNMHSYNGQYISYNDPRVRRTLDVPWGRN